MTTAQDLLQRKASVKVFTVGPNDTVLDASRTMSEAKIGALVVIDDVLGVIGMFTERDVLTRVVAAGKSPERTHVSEVMTTRVAYCTPETPVPECQDLMTQRRMRHLPVIDNGQLVGLISTGDIMAHEVTQQQVTIEYMHQYIQGRA